MMMFSLRPISWSRLPSMAASVSTRVVSWNDAADSHDSVASDALVIPISSGRPSAGRLALLDQRPVDLGVLAGVDPLAGQELGVTGLGHQHPPQHLAHDQLDVLVVDGHALGPVHLLHLVDQVLLGLPDALDLEQLLGVLGALDQGVAGRHLLALVHQQPGQVAGGDGVALLVAVVGDDGDDAALDLVVGHAHHTRGAGQDGLALGRTGLEQLHHPGQAVGDVAHRRCRRCGTSAW